MNRPTAPPSRESAFWERQETVERFASREPDHRLARLVAAYSVPGNVRVLDLGCAGGRNTVYLALRGFDVRSLDASRAMVEETRRRVLPILGAREAETRVREGRMDHLGEFDDGSIDWIVALGIYQSAASRAEWDRALSESARVLARGGRLLVASHTQRLDPEGKGLTPVPGEANLFGGMESGRAFLVDARELDLEMAHHGLLPFTPTYTVEVATESGGRRATANGFYQRP